MYWVSECLPEEKVVFLFPKSITIIMDAKKNNLNFGSRAPEQRQGRRIHCILKLDVC